MKEEKETQDDENKESKETQNKEKKEGTEEHSPHVISEEFQHEVIKLVDEYKDSKPCLEFMRSHVNRAEDELRKKEMNKGNKSKTPSEYSTADMPG